MSFEKTTVEWASLTEEQVRPQVYKRQDMRAVEYLAWGTPIFECRECMEWEAHVDIKDGHIIVREWHRPDCEAAERLRRESAICHDPTLRGHYCAVCGFYSAEEPTT